MTYFSAYGGRPRSEPYGRAAGADCAKSGKVSVGKQTGVLERVDIQDVQMNALIRDSKDMKARGVLMNPLICS